MKKNIILYLVTLILIPSFVVSIIYKSLSLEQNDYKKTKSNEEKITTVINEKTKEEKTIKIKINKNNNLLELNLEDYIVGVVAGEMPASFSKEALKAQAVASRTYAMYQMENNKVLEITTDDQVYNTIDEMKNKWNTNFEVYYNKVQEAVKETKNLIMKKNNKVFKSFYFAMSNGYTEDSKAVFGENNIQSVESPWDNETLNKFTVETKYTQEELKRLLKEETINIIEILSRDKTNRVESIKVNDKTYTGIEFRQILNLRSTDFQIKKENDIYIITTKGYGHGVGMSQYGANGMAKENYTYQEILKHYYQDIEICEI